MFRLGHYTNTVVGSVAVDMSVLPTALDVSAETLIGGGAFRSLNMSLTIDRIGRKRAWSSNSVAWLAQSQWWPIVRQWEQWRGPWTFYDGTRPNLLPSDAGLLTGWEFSGGSVVPTTDDGRAVMLGSSSVRGGVTKLAPVVQGTDIVVGITVWGTAGWSCSIQYEGFDAAGVSVGIVPAPATMTELVGPPGGLVQPVSVAAGGRIGYRCWAKFTVPAGTVYVRPIINQTNAALTTAVYFQDPVVLDSITDPGKAWHTVNIVACKPTHHRRGYATLALQLQEV